MAQVIFESDPFQILCLPATALCLPLRQIAVGRVIWQIELFRWRVSLELIAGGDYPSLLSQLLGIVELKLRIRYSPEFGVRKRGLRSISSTDNLNHPFAGFDFLSQPPAKFTISRSEFLL